MTKEIKKRRKEAKPRRSPVPIVIPNAENLSPEELAAAKKAEKQRRYIGRKRGVTDPGDSKKTGQEIRKIDTKELVSLAKDTRNLSLQLLNKKLEEIFEDPEARAKINLATLATSFGILFDKTQLMNGMATQNIAVQAKIDVNMTSDKIVEELSKMRESFQDAHQAE